MKRLFLLVLGLALMTGTITAQSTEDLMKERKELAKASKDELNQRVTKAAKKEAKSLKKEGWTTTPGAIPLEKQLDKSYTLQYQYDDDLFPKYVMAEAMSIGENYDAAKMQALELAKQNLAGQIQTEITVLIENTVANKQMGADEAASVTESVSAGKNLITQSIGRIIPVVEVYREKDNKNKEVLVRIAYNSDMARKAAKEAVRKDLEEKGDALHEKLDELLGW